VSPKPAPPEERLARPILARNFDPAPDRARAARTQPLFRNGRSESGSGKGSQQTRLIASRSASPPAQRSREAPLTTSLATALNQPSRILALIPNMCSINSRMECRSHNRCDRDRFRHPSDLIFTRTLREGLLRIGPHAADSLPLFKASINCVTHLESAAEVRPRARSDDSSARDHNAASSW